MKKILYLLFFLVSAAFLLNNCTQPYTQGKAIYDANCSRCHGIDGKGFEDLYPGITQSPYVTNSSSEIACVIAYGSTYLKNKKNTAVEIKMPANPQLSVVEILNIINYISWEFGDKQQRSIESITQLLEDCEP